MLFMQLLLEVVGLGFQLISELIYSQEAFTLPSLYLTAIYSLFDLANSQKRHASIPIIPNWMLLTFVACLDPFGCRRAGIGFHPAMPLGGRRGG